MTAINYEWVYSCLYRHIVLSHYANDEWLSNRTTFASTSRWDRSHQSLWFSKTTVLCLLKHDMVTVNIEVYANSLKSIYCCTTHNDLRLLFAETKTWCRIHSVIVRAAPMKQMERGVAHVSVCLQYIIIKGDRTVQNVISLSLDFCDSNLELH